MKANPGKNKNKKTRKQKRWRLGCCSELKLEKHVTGICNKASQKIHVLSTVTSYMSLNKRKTFVENGKTFLMKTFVESHFNYCPLIWMFHPDA